MFKTTITAENLDSPLLKKLWRGLAGDARQDIMLVAGRSAENAAKEYHSQYNQAGLWRGNRSFGSGGSKFGEAVADGWNTQDAAPSSVTISNDAEHLAHKVNGGTITPKRAKALTIPLIAEARGQTARDYARNKNTKLFTIKGKKALFEKTSTGIRPVFALVKSVTQGPWPGALPDDATILSGFKDGYVLALTDLLDQ
jgi:hypothetical protein